MDSRVAYLKWAGIVLLWCAAFSLLAACRAAPAASPSAVTSSPAAADHSQVVRESATPRPVNTPSTTATERTADDTAGRQLLGAVVGDAPMEISAVGHDESVGDLWDAVISRRITDQIGVDPATLRMAVARPASGREDEMPSGWMIMAVEHPTGDPIDVLGAYLAERLTRPGVEEALYDPMIGRSDIVIGSSFSLAWTDTTLFIMGYERVAILTDPQADAAQAAAVTVAVYGAIDALPLPDATPQPRPTQAPPDDAEPTPQPDRTMEMALPATVGGEPLTITSFASVRNQDLDGLDAGLFGHLLPHFEQSGTDAALGFASSESSPVLVVAHRLAGRTGDQLLAAALGELWRNPEGFQLYRGAEVDGRRYVYHQDWAFYAQGDILYFLLYYGGYDCSRESCTFGPDPEIADTVHDVVRVIPDASPADR